MFEGLGQGAGRCIERRAGLIAEVMAAAAAASGLRCDEVRPVAADAEDHVAGAV